MTVHRTLPRELDRRGFSVADALSHGLPASRMRTRDVSQPFHGVRVVGEVGTYFAQLEALSAKLRDHHALSGPSAATIWGLPLPSRLRSEHILEVITPLPMPRMQERGVIGRRLRADRFEVAPFGQGQVTSPALTLATCAKWLDEGELVVMLDALLTNANNYPGLNFTVRPALDAATLERFPIRFRGMNGMPSLRAAIERARPLVESPMESVLRVKLVDAGLPEPEVNLVIALPDGRTARADHAYPAARLLLDYEGDHHRVDAETWSVDIARVRALNALGFQHIRVTAADLRPEGFRALVSQIRRALNRAAAA